MRVLVCGDREWSDPGPIRDRLAQLSRETTLVHGSARGADRLAAQIALRLGWAPEQIEAHPANWDEHGAVAGPIRNQEMIATGIDLVLAFHDRLIESKGTADMVRRARKAGVPVEVIHSPAEALRLLNDDAQKLDIYDA